MKIAPLIAVAAAVSFALTPSAAAFSLHAVECREGDPFLPAGAAGLPQCTVTPKPISSDAREEEEGPLPAATVNFTARATAGDGWEHISVAMAPCNASFVVANAESSGAYACAPCTSSDANATAGLSLATRYYGMGYGEGRLTFSSILSYHTSLMASSLGDRGAGAPQSPYAKQFVTFGRMVSDANVSAVLSKVRAGLDAFVRPSVTTSPSSTSSASLLSAVSAAAGKEEVEEQTHVYKARVGNVLAQLNGVADGFVSACAEQTDEPTRAACVKIDRAALFAANMRLEVSGLYLALSGDDEGNGAADSAALLRSFLNTRTSAAAVVATPVELLVGHTTFDAYAAGLHKQRKTYAYEDYESASSVEPREEGEKPKLSNNAVATSKHGKRRKSFAANQAIAVAEPNSLLSASSSFAATVVVNATATAFVAMASYPSAVSSLDEWYTTGAGLVVAGTQIVNSNTELVRRRVSATTSLTVVPAFLRVMVANLFSFDAKQWVAAYNGTVLVPKKKKAKMASSASGSASTGAAPSSGSKKKNTIVVVAASSGGLSSRFTVADMKRFRPGRRLGRTDGPSGNVWCHKAPYVPSGTLAVVEDIAGTSVKSADLSAALRQRSASALPGGLPEGWFAEDDVMGSLVGSQFALPELWPSHHSLSGAAALEGYFGSAANFFSQSESPIDAVLARGVIAMGPTNATNVTTLSAAAKVSVGAETLLADVLGANAYRTDPLSRIANCSSNTNSDANECLPTHSAAQTSGARGDLNPYEVPKSFGLASSASAFASSSDSLNYGPLGALLSHRLFGAVDAKVIAHSGLFPRQYSEDELTTARDGFNFFLRAGPTAHRSLPHTSLTAEAEAATSGGGGVKSVVGPPPSYVTPFDWLADTPAAVPAPTGLPNRFNYSFTPVSTAGVGPHHMPQPFDPSDDDDDDDKEEEHEDTTYMIAVGAGGGLLTLSGILAITYRAHRKKVAADAAHNEALQEAIREGGGAITAEEAAIAVRAKKRDESRVSFIGGGTAASRTASRRRLASSQEADSAAGGEIYSYGLGSGGARLSAAASSAGRLRAATGDSAVGGAAAAGGADAASGDAAEDVEDAEIRTVTDSIRERFNQIRQQREEEQSATIGGYSAVGVNGRGHNSDEGNEEDGAGTREGSAYLPTSDRGDGYAFSAASQSQSDSQHLLEDEGNSSANLLTRQ